MKKVRNKESYVLVKKLRENKNKDPKTYWRILKSEQGNK